VDKAPTKIWIVRKGNGMVKVHPSPVVLRTGETFTIRNVTAAAATATFPAGTIDERPAKVEIPQGDTSADLRVIARAGSYFEYDLMLATGEYAEGGSKPGGIVDP
jgi:hypothetical protein